MCIFKPFVFICLTCITSSIPRSFHPPAFGSYNWVPWSRKRCYVKLNNFECNTSKSSTFLTGSNTRFLFLDLVMDWSSVQFNKKNKNKNSDLVLIRLKYREVNRPITNQQYSYFFALGTFPKLFIIDIVFRFLKDYMRQ